MADDADYGAGGFNGQAFRYDRHRGSRGREGGRAGGRTRMECLSAVVYLDYAPHPVNVFILLFDIYIAITYSFQ